MIALDTNILVYAHRSDSPLHHEARQKVRQLAEGSEPWGIPIPCFHEFFATVTHARVWAVPTPADLALEQISVWALSRSVTLLNYTATHLPTLTDLCKSGKISGGMIHDARIASICIENGVRELWTLDRDFSRFKALKTRNPLVS